MASDERQLDDWLDSYLRFTSETEPPTSYHTWIGISVIAATLQRKCYLPWGRMTFYPNMYVVLVGPSGKCRKGTAMGTGAKFLKDIGIKMAAEATTREALIRELKQTEGSTVDHNGLPELHASLTIYSQELTVFLGYDNKQLISDMTDWYDCRDTWTYRTKNMGTDEITNLWVNLIGATTPELVQSALPRDAVGGGLASRIIFVYEQDKKQSVPFPFLNHEDVQLRDKLRDDLELISQIRGPFKWTEDFLDVYGSWYLEQEASPPFSNDPNFQGYVQRRANHIFKLCIILSASRDSNRIIDASIFKKAKRILDDAELKMGRTFSGYGTSRLADVTTRIMTLLANRGSANYKELLSTFYADLEEGRRTLDNILDTLVAMNYCTRHDGGDGFIYKFNPGSTSGKTFNQ